MEGWRVTASWRGLALVCFFSFWLKENHVHFEMDKMFQNRIQNSMMYQNLTFYFGEGFYFGEFSDVGVFEMLRWGLSVILLLHIYYLCIYLVYILICIRLLSLPTD